MSEKFRDKFRVSSTRLLKWDYSKNGYYFITICLADRQCIFGEIKDGRSFLNKIGNLVKGFWLEIPHHFPFVTLDEFVIMPNHVHGILIIDREFVSDSADDYLLFPDRPMVDYLGPIASKSSEPAAATATLEKGQCPVSTNPAVTDSELKPINRFRNQGKNTISSIVGSFKSICTKTINKMDNKINFAWQERFFDEILRDETALFQIRNYIKDNPAKWQYDKNNPIKL
jgi:REP element-mobilizing transposase RayT